MGRFFSLILCTLFIQNVFAEAPQYGFSKEQNLEMKKQNERIALRDAFYSKFTFSNSEQKDLLKTTAVRPWAEFEDAGYLIFSSDFDFASGKAKTTMAQNLPDGVTLVVYTGSTSMEEARHLKDKFSAVLDSNRVKIVYMPRGERGFWARDGVPVPVLRRRPNSDNFLTLVDAVYYHNFEADEEFGTLFQSQTTNHDYYFEGGNFIANSKNECLIVDKTATQEIPDEVFQDHYGCKVLTRLPHVKGIGHADESVKFIDDETVLTDEISYRDILEEKGYTVRMLPRPERKYETYVNSLMINGVVYVPVFNEKTDQDALDVYTKAGFEKVIGINSKSLSNKGLGSLHCITMTYPPVEMDDLVVDLGGFVLL